MDMDNSIVYINLTDKNAVQEKIQPELRRKYIGGCGINTKILFDSEAMYNDPLSEKNVLIFGVGAAVGTGLPASNRCTITAKSPITDLYGDSNVGGEFNIRMRAVGIDHMVFTGRSDTPVYVFINKDGEVQFLDAADIWGTWTDKVTDILTERHGNGCAVACIGPAGEKLVRFASVIMSKCHVAGRTGMGCIMGSKNLKAVVIEKKPASPYVYDPERVKAIGKVWINSSRSSLVSKSGSIEGTLMLIKRYEKQKCIPIRNFQTDEEQKIKNIYPEKFLYKHETKRKACISCPVGCAREYEINEGKHKGEKGDRLDFGAIAGVGTIVGIFDWPEILHLKALADYLGIDAIEFGGVAGLILECQQRGIIPEAYKSDNKLKFGDADDIEKLMLAIASREGLGDIAAEGAYRAAKSLNAEKYAFCIRKSAAGLHTKSHLAKSLSYVTSTRGGDHLKAYVFTSVFGGFISEIVSKYIFREKAERNFANPEKKGRVVWWHENYKYIIDSLGLCLFMVQALPSMGVALFRDFAEVINAQFNLDLKDIDVFLAAERIYQLQNAFNLLCGGNINDYSWPKRLKEKDIDDGIIDRTTIESLWHEGMLPEYFRFRGLNKEGRATIERFRELGLEEYAEKAKTVEYRDIEEISTLIKDLALNLELSRGEKRKSKIVSSLLCKLLEKKDMRNKMMSAKQKEKNRTQTQTGVGV